MNVRTSERSNTVCAGSNEGGVGVFDYPSFRKTVKVLLARVSYA